MEPWHDPEHEANSDKHHTGKTCVESSCERHAGTAWSPLWCQPCNAERIDRIDRSMGKILARFDELEEDA